VAAITQKGKHKVSESEQTPLCDLAHPDPGTPMEEAHQQQPQQQTQEEQQGQGQGPSQVPEELDQQQFLDDVANAVGGREEMRSRACR